MQSTELFEGSAPRFDSFKQEAMKELYKGKPLMGEDGIFTPLLKRYAAAARSGSDSSR